MIVVVEGSSVTARETDDLTRLSVITTEGDEALASLVADHLGGEVRGGDVLIDAALLEELGRQTVDREWTRRYRAMVAFAEGRGWVVDGRVQAHIEYPAGEAEGPVCA